MTLIDELLFGLGCVLVGGAVTIRLLCGLSEAAVGSSDPIERVLTLVFTGVPGTLGLLLIAKAVL